MTPALKLIASLPVCLVLTSCSGETDPKPATTAAENEPAATNTQPESEQVLRIAAAANLAAVLPAVIETYNGQTEQETGAASDSKTADSKPKIEVTYASSGKLFAQINSGAPYDIFLSADQDFPAKYAEQQKAAGKTATPFTYARGQLALYSSNHDLSAVKTLDQPSLQQLFGSQQGKALKIGIANPDLAPYGASAKAFLQQQQMYDTLNTDKKLIQAENIGQAFQYAHTATTDYGFVALSQLIGAKVEPSKYLILQPDSYPAILQDGVVVSDHPQATDFSNYLLSEPAQKQFEVAGYLPVTSR